MMHQHKDWKTFSKFSHALISAKSQLEGILACGTDGETALIKRSQRNFRFAVFLRCYIHFKENIKRELSSRGFPTEVIKLFMDDKMGDKMDLVSFMGS